MYFVSHSGNRCVCVLCVCLCVRACVRACVSACMCAVTRHSVDYYPTLVAIQSVLSPVLCVCVCVCACVRACVHACVRVTTLPYPCGHTESPQSLLGVVGQLFHGVVVNLLLGCVSCSQQEDVINSTSLCVHF